MQHISDMSRELSIVSDWGLLLFSFMECSVLTIIYVFSFFLVFKLYRFGLQIVSFISDYLVFLDSVDIKGYLVVEYFERWILTLGHF